MVKRIRDERGYVAALFAICLVGFILLIGFAVDLGNWYLSANRIQRASDVAALSAAVSLPDVMSAVNAGKDSLKRNGFQDGVNSVQTSISVSNGSVNVEVTNNAVPTYFLKLVKPSISISRKARAEKSDEIPLGNPFNVFGYGDERLDLGGDVKPQGYWAAINGPCSPREDGDYFSALRDGNKYLEFHKCGAADGSNADYNPGGYNYIVEVPEGASNVSIRVFSGTYSPDNEKDMSDKTVPDIRLRRNLDTDEGFDTAYRVTRVQGSAPSPSDPNVGLQNGARFFNGHPYCKADNGDQRMCWTVLATGLGPGKYRINVTSLNYSVAEDAGTVDYPATGVNSYALMASEANKLDEVCDTRKSTTCPSVVGYGAVSTYQDGKSGDATYYLAQIPPEMAGSQISVSLFDPGEGMDTMEVLTPDGKPVSFSYKVEPVVGTESGGGPTHVLNVSGKAPPARNNLQGDGKFNDRMVTLTFTAPAYSDAGNDTWYKLRYKSGTGVVTDRITFGVNASAVAPVRLTSNN